MLKAKNGRTKAKGTINEVLTDLAHLSGNVVEFLQEAGVPREEGVKVVKEVVDIGCMTSEERRAKAEKQFDEFMDMLFGARHPKGNECSGDTEKKGEQADE